MMNSSLLFNKFKHHSLDSVLEEIYGKETDMVNRQCERYCDAIKKYIDLFGDEDIEIYSAPGRTEICGNHTDHQNGMVLAASINLDAIAVVGKSENSMVDFVSEGYSPIRCDISNLSICEEEKETTTALIKGVIKGMQNQGYHTGAFKAYVTSDILSGSGLSSSAALEALLGTIQSGLFNNMEVSPVDIAMIGQYAENVYFGKPCGLMDQIACSVGDFVQIDFKIPGKPQVHKLAYDLASEGYHLCIVDTKGSHANLTDDYAAIPQEMKQVAAFFHKELLGEVTMEDFLRELPALYGSVNDRAILRAYHFFTENERVKRAAAALEANHFTEFLSVIKESGNSSFRYLQNVYSSHNSECQPIPMALAFSEYYLKDNGVCRVHGGGFAGTIQAFVKDEAIAGYKEFIEKIFGEGTCHVLKIRKQGGMKVQ